MQILTLELRLPQALDSTFPVSSQAVPVLLAVVRLLSRERLKYSLNTL